MSQQEIQKGIELLGLTDENKTLDFPAAISPPGVDIDNAHEGYTIRLSSNTGGGKLRKG